MKKFVVVLIIALLAVLFCAFNAYQISQLKRMAIINYQNSRKLANVSNRVNQRLINLEEWAGQDKRKSFEKQEVLNRSGLVRRKPNP